MALVHKRAEHLASGAEDKRSTVKFALETWAGTIRLCMILIAMSAPADIWLIWH